MKRLLQGLVSALLLRALPAPAEIPLTLLVFEDPPAAVVVEIAGSPLLDVRWAERGLIVAETSDPDRVPPHWQARSVAQRFPGDVLALLRAPDRTHLQADGGAAVLSKLQSSLRATARASAGPVWLLTGSPESWPAEVLGCHGGLLLPPHGVDPRGVLDAAPPEALRRWTVRGTRPLRGPERAVLAAVSQDSIKVSLAALTRDALGQPADRHVFGTDLDGIYSPRVEASMSRAVQGIPGSSVRRESFAKSRVCGGEVQVDSTYNVIARLPGQVPGTGVFVVCAHIDATGSRNAAWQQARDACEPLDATPGAEDNATGVAAMLEILRCTAEGVQSGALEFAFDLEFIAFSGEEAEGSEGGLTGSRRYVEARTQEGRKLLGAFNLDMVGSDSLGNNLQVVHNVASRWLADWLVDAALQVDPPIDLDTRLDLDESLASDHNSFWLVNAPAILGADAPIDVLRRYASYHRPTDVGDEVSLAKTAEVSRAFLAAVLQFNRLAHDEPALVFPQDLQLRIAPQGIDLAYDPDFFRLWPGGPLRARFSLVNTGAPYAAPLGVQMWVRCPRGTPSDPPGRLFFECVDDSCFARGGAARPLQTGDRLDLVADPVPIAVHDRGDCEVVAHVGFTQGGRDSVAVFLAPFVVAEQRGLPLSVRPSPARGADAAHLTLGLERPGTLLVQLYNVAGRRVARQTGYVEPSFQSQRASVDVPLHFEGQAVPSGVYYVRAEWTGAGGERATSTTRLVLVR